MAVSLKGQVLGAGAPIANSTVTLWAAGEGAPTQLTQTQTGDDGRFELRADGAPGNDAVLYLVATGGQPAANKAGGDNPAIALMTVLGTTVPKTVTVNELTTVASAFTAARFINGEAISGNPLGLRIAAGNVPNLVDPETGGWGKVILDPINSTQTTSLATLNTLGSLIAASFTVANDDWRARFFKAATPLGGVAPKNTLEAMAGIARAPWAQPKALFALYDEAYPQPKDGARRKAPFVPYLAFVPEDFALSLAFAGGGIYGSGSLAIDANGNLWGTQNWLPGSQATNLLSIGGGVSKLAPNGTVLSPAITGFTGMGGDGFDWGLAITQDHVWASSFTGAILLMDLNGKPIGKEGDFALAGKIGTPQGIAIAPNGDVWVADALKNSMIYFPGGRVQDERRVEVKGLVGPFAVAVDNQNRVFVSNARGNTVVRFAADDPSKAEIFKVGFGPRGISLDSKGNLWVASQVSNDFPPPALPAGLSQFEIFQLGGEYLWKLLNENPNRPMGFISMIRPDGTQPAPEGFVGGQAMRAPWSARVDGNDDVWIANFGGRSLALMAGADPKGYPSGTKTGDVIHQFHSGSLQYPLDVAIDPAGNVWINNNWNDYEMAIARNPPRRTSTWGGGSGCTVWYGVAAPVKTPLIGQVRAP